MRVMCRAEITVDAVWVLGMDVFWNRPLCMLVNINFSTAQTNWKIEGSQGVNLKARCGRAGKRSRMEITGTGLLENHKLPHEEVPYSY